MVRVASIFSQILQLFPRSEFEVTVRRHGAERYSKGFGSWDQFVAMLFCQLAQARSLNEISRGLASCEGKLRHLGVAGAPKRSTLAYANEHRPWQLQQDVFMGLLGRCRMEAERGRRKFRFRNKLVSIDSTVVELSLSMFDWAHYQRTKGAIKLHMLLDHDGYLPTYVHLTDGKVSDVEVARQLVFPPESIVVMDRGYTDYEMFADWTDRRVWFVTRDRRSTEFSVVLERPVTSGSGVIADQVIELSSDHAAEQCDNLRLRRIVFQDPKRAEPLVFLTNHMRLAASTVAAIYKERWQIELLFKALKQNLRIKTFVGTSANAVHTQIWTALIAMLLLRYLQLRSTLGWALSNLVALLRWNLFTYRDLWAWIDNPTEVPPLIPEPQQMQLW
jgi:IS4 transposase